MKTRKWAMREYLAIWLRMRAWDQVDWIEWMKKRIFEVIEFDGRADKVESTISLLPVLLLLVLFIFQQFLLFCLFLLLLSYFVDLFENGFRICFDVNSLKTIPFIRYTVYLPRSDHSRKKLNRSEFWMHHRCAHELTEKCLPFALVHSSATTESFIFPSNGLVCLMEDLNFDGEVEKSVIANEYKSANDRFVVSICCFWRCIQNVQGPFSTWMLKLRFIAIGARIFRCFNFEKWIHFWPD